MKTLTQTKRVSCFNFYFLFVMAFGLVISFSSCSNDDDQIPVQSLKDVDGEYIGKMLAVNTNPQVKSVGEPNQGVDVNADIKNDSVFINKFPISDLVKSIINDEENAETIIKAIGDINYKVYYQAVFNEMKDSIYMQLKPEPLNFKFEIPAENEGDEATKVNITVTLTSVNKGAFAYENKNLKFGLQATEVKMNDNPIQFPLTSLNFNLNKK